MGAGEILTSDFLDTKGKLFERLPKKGSRIRLNLGKPMEDDVYKRFSTGGEKLARVAKLRWTCLKCYSSDLSQPESWHSRQQRTQGDPVKEDLQTTRTSRSAFIHHIECNFSNLPVLIQKVQCVLFGGSASGAHLAWNVYFKRLTVISCRVALA